MTARLFIVHSVVAAIENDHIIKVSVTERNSYGANNHLVEYVNRSHAQYVKVLKLPQIYSLPLAYVTI